MIVPKYFSIIRFGIFANNCSEPLAKKNSIEYLVNDLKIIKFLSVGFLILNINFKAVGKYKRKTITVGKISLIMRLHIPKLLEAKNIAKMILEMFAKHKTFDDLIRPYFFSIFIKIILLIGTIIFEKNITIKIVKN